MNYAFKKIIDAAIKNRTPELNLISYGLTEIPERVFEMTWLRKLSLDNKMSVIPDSISALTDLSELHIRTIESGRGLIKDISPLSQLKKLESLDIRNQLIDDIAPLRSLYQLKGLILFGNEISDISALSGLKNLAYLDLGNNRIFDIQVLAELEKLTMLNLAANKLVNIQPLKGLKNITHLYLYDNLIEDISPLQFLTKSEGLFLSGNNIKNIMPLLQLTKLRSLWMERNLISELPDLSTLSSLAELFLTANAINDISGLNGLPALTLLYLMNNELTDISVLKNLPKLQKVVLNKNNISTLEPILPLYERGGEISVDENPLQHPPLEIAKQGNEAVLNYFKALKQGQSELYEAKLLIVGAGGAGKTSLRLKMNNPGAELPEQQETTRSIDIEPHQFTCPNGKQFTMNMWDFGGQEIYHATHQFFLTKRSLYALVSDTRKEDADFDYWMQVIELLSEKSPVMMIQNEIGGRSKSINFNGLCTTYESIEKPLYTIDLADIDERFYKLRDALERRIQQLPHVGQTLPAQWVKVREALGKTAEAHAYITFAAYLKVCDQNGIAEEEQALHLSAYLHDLGSFLHFKDDPVLRNTIILQNRWATDAVYAVLNDEIVKGKQGEFDKADMLRIWSQPAYKNMHNELAGLMVKFELCYPLPDHAAPRYIAPQLLSVEMPLEVSKWDRQDALTIRLYYTFMLKGIISRFIVRMHAYIKSMDMAWKTGVVLWRGSNEALVEEVSKNQVNVHVRGNQSRELMAIILDEFERINRTFPRTLEMKKQIPCNCAVCVAGPKTHYYEYEDLITRLDKGKNTVECNVSYEVVDVNGLIDYSLLRKRNPADSIKNYLFEGIPSDSDSVHSIGEPAKDIPMRLTMKTAREMMGYLQKTDTGISPLRVFISYSKSDIQHKDEFVRHLSVLRRTDKIITWNDQDMPPAEEWGAMIKEQLQQADVIVFLVSARSLATDYIWEVEMKEALKRHEAGTAKVVPVILSPCDWQHSPFRSINALPEKGKPISEHADQQAAWAYVTTKMRGLTETFRREKVFNEEKKL